MSYQSSTQTRFLKMNFSFLWTFLLLLAGGLTGSKEAHATAHINRCLGDPGYPDQARRRVAWALRCGHIDQEDANYLNKKHQYPTYRIPGVNIYLWFDEHAPCYPYVEEDGTCTAVGCFAADTQLLFPQGLKTLKEAHDEGLENIMALGEWQTFDSEFELVETPIDVFISGPTKEILIEIATVSKKIKVTVNHPMVAANGEVISAEDLVAGVSVLATLDGPEVVESLKSVEYEGDVWNVEVQSEAAEKNIHVAEGFLTGGFRYQNEWVDEEIRHPRVLNIGFQKN